MAALAYPEIIAAGEAIAYGFQAIAAAVPLIGFAITKPWHHHHSQPDAHATTHGRDITDDDDQPEAVPEIHYRYNGQHVSDANEVGHLDRERKFIRHHFQMWAMHVYGHRYRYLTGIALDVARRRYRKWRLHGPHAQHTPLRTQVRQEVMRNIGFETPPRKRRRPRKYTRSELYAL